MQSPNTTERVAADEMVSIEFNDIRCDHVKTFLNADIFLSILFRLVHRKTAAFL